jgi:hypothetical protein
LRLDEIERLDRIIYGKSWANLDNEFRPDKTVRQSLMDVIANLKGPEIALFLDLLEDYLIVTEYRSYARRLLDLVVHQSGPRNLYITPILEYGKPKTKSGQTVHYDLGSFTGHHPDKNILLVDDPALVTSMDAPHYCVDDFIGSGDQFLTMMQHLRDRGLNPTVTGVASIVVHSLGLARLQDAGYRVISIFVTEKAFNCSTGRFFPELEAAYRTYDRIEARLACGEKFARGYSGCEALVTMKKTPNNTLPIFWFEGKKRWPAPFPKPRK